MNLRACLLCEEVRGIQICHIISRKLSWVFKRFKKEEDRKEYINGNLLYLCPNHHFYFDNGLLNKEEKEKLQEIIKGKLNVFLETILKLKEKDSYQEIFNKDFDKVVKHFVLRNKTLKEILEDRDIKMQPLEVVKDR